MNYQQLALTPEIIEVNVAAVLARRKKEIKKSKLKNGNLHKNYLPDLFWFFLFYVPSWQCSSVVLIVVYTLHLIRNCRKEQGVSCHRLFTGLIPQNATCISTEIIPLWYSFFYEALMRERFFTSMWPPWNDMSSKTEMRGRRIYDIIMCKNDNKYKERRCWQLPIPWTLASSKISGRTG